VRRLLPPGGTPRALGGVCPGARALAVAGLLDGAAAAVVVVPAPLDVEDMLAGLALLAPAIAAATIPPEAMEGYLGRTPPVGAAAVAVRALAGLESGAVRVLVVPARIVPYPLPRPEALDRRSPRLDTGRRTDLRELAVSLVEIGYRRAEVVEEAGEFAIRGQIADIGTPDAFARLVLDLDLIESIRCFDPASQRSGQAISSLRVPPLRLFAGQAGDRARLAALLESHDCRGASQAALEAHTPQWWEGFLGWAEPHANLWELAPRVIVCEAEAVAAEIERSFAALRHAHAALATDEALLPPPDAWLTPPDTAVAALAAADRVESLLVEDAAQRVDLGVGAAPVLATQPQLLVRELRRGVEAGWRQAIVAASAGEAQRLTHLLADAEIPHHEGWPERASIGLVTGSLSHGFQWGEPKVAVFGRSDVTHMPPPARPRRTLATVLAAMRDLKPGDFVVHSEHGIGRFAGFRTLELEGERHETVELQYEGGGKLLVPLERADVLEKYAGSEGAPPRLDRLGGSTWSRTTSRVKRALKDMAEELLKTQAQRELASGFAYSKDSPWQRDFEAAFEYELTTDQEQAIREIKRDMESSRPMDRLLVGDVGYGKTEVAMRAAFKAVLDGKQVAVLAPTTILAEQHVRTFRRRLAGFPVEIRWLSRFLPTAEQRAVAQGIRDGTVDLVVGTHRLLAKDVSFRDLGLLIVDEEQRFGVGQKERLKAIKAVVDVLALSATPIPRTLNLGLTGLRDVSIIETPPRDRLAVQTHVLPFRKEIVREAILNEMARGGQVFFVHNRVASMGGVASLLREVVPEARVAVAHGQMDERELERNMDAFLDGRADVLLATAIIENGLDIPNANTLIVNRADRFGLAQLYQLRGRVGRSDRLAFSYLLVPPDRSLSEEARARLAAILEFAELGAGFRIAARDLEIRGAGNMLGAEQHGHLRAVGYETYCRLLEEAVAELRGEAATPPPSAVELRLGLDLRLPEEYLSEDTLRLTVYRRIAAARSDEELTRVREECTDRFGDPPPQLDHLIAHQRVRRRAEALGIARVRRTRLGWEIALDPQRPDAHAVAMAILAASPDATLSPTGMARVPAPGSGPLDAAARLLEMLPQDAADRSA
jgi:transcription-repair coupling factor (superfamily II helicase)